MGLYGVDAESFAATPPSPACCHYVSYLLATAATRSIAETVAALLPCFWVYRDVGHAIHAVAAPDNPYGRRDVWRAGVSVRAIAAGQSPFHGRPFVRNGMTRVAWRSMMAVWQRRLWQRRVSQAPSAVTAPIASPSGIWVSRAGSTGRLPVAAGGEFHRPDARRGVLHGQMRLAP